jgi:hypothetical protein
MGMSMMGCEKLMVRILAELKQGSI